MRRFQFTSTTLSFRYQPLFAVAVAFATGILVQHFLNLKIGYLLAGLCAALLIAVVVSQLNHQSYPILLIGLLLAGATLAGIEMQSLGPDRLRSQVESELLKTSEPAEVVGTLIAPPEKVPGRIYLDLSTEKISQFKAERNATGNIRLSLFLTDDEVRQEFENLHLDYGSRIRTLAILSRSEQYRNPGVTDFDEFLIQQGYDLAAQIKSPLLIENLGEGRCNPFLARLYNWRVRGLDAIDANFDRESAAILKAVVFGERHFLDNATQERFKAAGTFHILVIAGLHIAFAAGICLWLLSLLTKSRWLRLIILLPLLWGYVVMVGAQPPAVRASLVITVALFGDALFRAKFGINTISVSAIILLALRPSDLFTGSFQLTFLTVILIGLISVPLIERMRAIGQWRPASDRPYPPRCNRFIRWLSEVAFWHQSDHDKFMHGSPVQYRLDKSRTAIILEKLRLQWLVRAVLSTVIISITVQLGLLPVMALYFNRAAMVGIILNIPVALFMIAFLVFSGCFLLAKFLVPALAGKIYFGVTASRYLLSESIDPFIKIDWASFRVPHYSGKFLILYLIYLIPILYSIVVIHLWNPLALRSVDTGNRVFAILRSRPLFYSYNIIFVSLAVIMFVLTTVHPVSSYQPGKLTLSFLDVGQGDSIFIRFPRGKTMLVDSGGRITFVRDTENDDPFAESGFSIGEAVVSRYLWSQGIDHLDYIVATHGDSDHIEGFTDVIKNFRIGEAITGVVPSNDPEFNTFKQLLDRRSVPLQILTRGDHLQIDDVEIEAMSPEKLANAPIQSENNHSLVLKLTYGERSILLTGDVEREAESQMLTLGEKLHADVLKVPHHGSRTSSIPPLLNAVHPTYAVISVGEYSRFGHPNIDVVERYQRAGIHLFQTGRNGTVTVATDGHTLDVSTYVPSGEIPYIISRP